MEIEEYKAKRKKRRLKKSIKIFLVLILLILVWKVLDKNIIHNSQKEELSQNNIKNDKIIGMYENRNWTNIANTIKVEVENTIPKKKVQKKPIDDWRLVLVNYENTMPTDFEVKLASIDKYRQIDERVLPELNQMLKDIKNDEITNIWVQSAYRSVSRQQKIYNDKVNMYLEEGLTLEEAEELTRQTINVPETSEHNLGLAIDFNYVDYEFENAAAYEWLVLNAENYGFILRYPKDKVDITKVEYEPWHWRYVGVEHAKEMNKLEMCLEEYIEYLYYE